MKIQYFIVNFMQVLYCRVVTESVMPIWRRGTKNCANNFFIRETWFLIGQREDYLHSKAEFAKVFFNGQSDIIGEKLKFLSNEALKGELLVKTISKDPFCLRLSLKKAIIPCVYVICIYLTKEEFEEHVGRILRHASSKIKFFFQFDFT